MRTDKRPVKRGEEGYGVLVEKMHGNILSRKWDETLDFKRDESCQKHCTVYGDRDRTVGTFLRL